MDEAVGLPMSSDRLFVETPYDRGSPWNLRLGEESARISAETALVLMACGVQMSCDGVTCSPAAGSRRLPNMRAILTHCTLVAEWSLKTGPIKGGRTTASGGTRVSIKLTKRAADMIRRSNAEVLRVEEC